jgi:hypothetical protein
MLPVKDQVLAAPCEATSGDGGDGARSASMHAFHVVVLEVAGHWRVGSALGCRDAMISPSADAAGGVCASVTSQVSTIKGGAHAYTCMKLAAFRCYARE